MVDIKRSVEWIENHLVMPVQILCAMPRPEQLDTLYHRNIYSDSTLTVPET